MNLKSILVFVLLAFVLVSIVLAISRGTSSSEPEGPAVGENGTVLGEETEPVAEPGGDSSTEITSVSEPDLPDSCIVVYYFHGNARCSSCIKFENYTNQIMTTDYAAQLGDGSIQWLVINVDESENSHYKDRYELFTRAVIVSERIDGGETRWKDLKDIWRKVGNEDDFSEYIRSEVDAWLTDSGNGG